MARPRAIEEGAKRSRELIKQITESQQEADSNLEAGINQHLDELKGDQTPSNGQDQTDPTAGEAGNEQSDGQATTPPEQTSEPDPKHQQRPDGDEKRQQRIEELERENNRLVQANTVLRSKYDAEVPRMAADIRELKEQLKRQNEPPAGNTETPAAANTEAVEKIKKALLDEYPSDVVNNLEQLIQSHVKAGLPAQQEGAVTESQVQELRDQVQSTMAQLREQRLTSLVPDWKKIEAQENAQWIKFLQYVDPISGRERNDFLREAWNAHDVERVAEIFNLYKRERDASKPPPSTREQPPVTPDDQGSRSTPNLSDDSNRTYTRSEIAHTEKMARAGKFKGREAELERLRKRYRVAAAKGLVDSNS